MNELPKGFETLLDTADEIFGQRGNLRAYAELDITKVRPGPWQPRQVFDEEEIDNLAASITQNGQLDPILVVHRDGMFLIVAGERRFRALQKLGHETIEAILLAENTSDQKLRELAIISNVQREDLDPLEEAESYKMLMDEHHHTLESLGEALGKKKSTVHDVLLLNNLPNKIRKDFRTSGNRISKSVLIEVAREKKTPKQLTLWKAVRGGSVTNVRQARAAKKAGRPPTKRTIKERLVKDAAVMLKRIEEADREDITFNDQEYHTLLDLYSKTGAYLNKVGEKK